MNTKTTISDIAKELNITTATVSRALNHHPAISNETKRRVQQVAERLNYSRNKIASSLRLGRTQVIGVMIPSAEINFFGSVVHGIESIASEYDYSVLIYQSNESAIAEQKGLEAFMSARVDGILVSIAKQTRDFSHFLAIKKRGIPLVFFDRANDNLSIPSVVIDDYKGAFIATEHLIQQGYQRIAHISGPQHLKIFKDRLNGYIGALQAYNLSVADECIIQGDVSIESGTKAVSNLLKMADPPDAVFAVEDFTALGVIKELKKQNRKIPEEFGVVGFANEAFGEHITPSLSSIDQQTVQMGKEACKLVLEMINQRGMGPQVKSKVILEPLPVFRQSSLR